VPKTPTLSSPTATATVVPTSVAVGPQQPNANDPWARGIAIISLAVAIWVAFRDRRPKLKVRLAWRWPGPPNSKAGTLLISNRSRRPVTISTVATIQFASRETAKRELDNRVQVKVDKTNPFLAECFPTAERVRKTVTLEESHFFPIELPEIVAFRDVQDIWIRDSHGKKWSPPASQMRSFRDPNAEPKNA
jgi:hypothetical protein